MRCTSSAPCKIDQILAHVRTHLSFSGALRQHAYKPRTVPLVSLPVEGFWRALSYNDIIDGHAQAYMTEAGERGVLLVSLGTAVLLSELPHVPH